MITSDSEALAENKVLILYILNKVNKPINNDSLYKLVLSALDINYFYFQQFLLDLIQNKYIVNFHKETRSVYEITESGKNTLALTMDLLPGIIKLKADMNLKKELESTEEEYSVVAEYTPRSENNYIVFCKIVENSETIFEVKTFAGSRENAKEIVQNWKNNAESIYPEILRILTTKKDNTDELH
jgi:predicted transcriptional regulator